MWQDTQRSNGVQLSARIARMRTFVVMKMSDRLTFFAARTARMSAWSK
jgi:hypothetical protein